MVLVFLFQTSQYGNGFCRCRLIHHHHLESSFKRLVRFEVFLILIQRSGTDSPQFATGQCRFEDVGRIHRSGSPAGADKCMDFINEQNYLPLTVHYILYHAFKPFLEFTLIFGACYKRTHIQ